MDEDIREDENQVEENATPETDTQETEQRTDDYDGLARRIDDVIRKLDELKDDIKRVEGMYSTFVDAGAIVTDATDAITEAAAIGIASAMDEIYDLETLDYTL